MSRIERALERASLLRKQTEEEADTFVGFQKSQSSVQTVYPTADGQIKVSIDSPYVVTANDPHSPISEEFRKLKSIILKLIKQGNFTNTLMVTSSVPNEGKSLTSLNLAISLAYEHDHTVLLIDADLRKPSLHTYLSLDNDKGLVDCLKQTAQIEEVIVNTGIGKLSIIPGGQPLQSPAELFSSQNMQNMLNAIKHRYADRIVIIDSPPVLPFAETRVLSQLVDGVILVVKEGAVSSENITEVLHALKKNSVIGVVFNEATVSMLDMHYSYYSTNNPDSLPVENAKPFWRKVMRR